KRKMRRTGVPFFLKAERKVVGRKIPLVDDVLPSQRRSAPDPTFDRESFLRTEGTTIGHLNQIIDPIKAERLPNHAGCERRSLQELSVIAADVIIRVTIARPPSDQTRRWRNGGGSRFWIFDFGIWIDGCGFDRCGGGGMNGGQ